MAGELAAVYVSLIPAFRGGAAAIARELGGPAEAAGRDAGDRFGGSFGDSVRGLAATGALFGGVAILASSFNTALTQADLPGALASQFGLAEGAAGQAAETAAAVYASGWGASLGEVGTAVGEVTRQLDQLGQTGDVQALTTQAQALADRFGQDVGQAITSASQMVKTGLAPDMESAMDIMVAGFQSGADSGQDLLDTVTEYSTQFRNLGLDGATAMGLINQGMQSGARNSDILADALKEFSIRAIDGTALTAQGFDAIGLSAEEMAATFAAGGPEAAAALDVVLDRLRAMEDPVARDAAAVSLFGTTAEDLGDSLYALDPSEATNALGDFTGAASEVANATGESARASLSEFGRTFTTGLAEHITPLLPHLDSLVDKLLPLTPVLVGLAIAIGIAAAAMGLWRVAVIAATVVMAIWRAAVVIATIVQIAWNIALALNPIGLVVLAIILLIAIIAGLIIGIVALVKNWDTVVAALGSAWQWIKDQTSAIWNSIVDFVVGIGDRIVGWVESHALEILAAYGWLQALPGRVAGWFGDLADSAIEQGQRLLDWAQGIPDWITSALGDLGGLLVDAGRDLVNGLLEGLEDSYDSVRDSLQGLTSSMTDWKGPPKRDRRLFTPAGRSIIDSLLTGFDARIPRVRTKLEGLTGDLPGMVRTDLEGPTVRLAAADRELLARGDGVMIARIPVDLGDGVREVIEVELERHDARLARGALAGTGRVR